jgi:ArsR family transcriptional regulator, arsenate/arsenite/antimonite-responsive transcriptional repressor / arsenate reductase (thioredoxin)
VIGATVDSADADADSAQAALAFLRLAGEPVRWRLLRELARSDRHVRELTELIGRPQNLVSYHLGKLRAAGLVRARRSSADGRDAYYTVALDRFGDLLALSGRSLHPGLQLAPVVPAAPDRAAVPARVLFLCTGNSGRSQLAEALTRARSAGRVQAFSAGSRPKPVHPHTARVLGERGIDFGDRRAKHLDTFAAERFSHVITLCDKVREVCPEFPGHPGSIHWSVPDPAGPGSDDDQILAAFRQVAAELDTRIGYLLAGLGARPGTRSP